MKQKVLLSILSTLGCLMATLHSFQIPIVSISCNDEREVSVRLAGTGATIIGLYAMALTDRSIITGALLTATGIIGMLYPEKIVEQVDNIHDHVMEKYYESKINSEEPTPNDVVNYAYYAAKNKIK